jgi:hypothetical protein
MAVPVATAVPEAMAVPAAVVAMEEQEESEVQVATVVPEESLAERTASSVPAATVATAVQGNTG